MAPSINKGDKPAGNLLSVEIISPSYKGKLAYEGLAQSVTSFNVEGTFDVLPYHENFVTLVNDMVIVVDKEGNKREFAVGKALLEASNNVVKIFVDF